MQTDYVLKNYWDVFNAHVCKYYPLDKNFIHQYAYELDWDALIQNTLIDWDAELIDRYQNEFGWSFLLRNESIIWSFELIEKFKKRILWDQLSMNKKLPLTDALLLKYGKKLTLVEDHPELTKALIEKYKLKTQAAFFYDGQELYSFENTTIENVFQSYNMFSNPQYVIYKEVILPIIETMGLNQIFETKFNYTQRYFFMQPIYSDINGLTPSFELTDLQYFSEGAPLTTIDKIMELHPGPYQEGADRLYEMPRLHLKDHQYHPLLLISEGLKQTFEKYKLPPHRFHKVQLNPKKITPPCAYYMFQIEPDTLTKDLDFASLSFYYKSEDWQLKRQYGAVDKSIKNYEDIKTVQNAYYDSDDEIMNSAVIYPNQHKIISDYDVYSLDEDRWIVTEMLKNELETLFPNQIQFRSAQLLNIEMDDKLYQAKKGKTSNQAKQDSKVIFSEDESVLHYTNKMQRLIETDPKVPVKLLNNDAFTAIEKELDVIFPSLLKEQITAKKLDQTDYELLPIDEFYVQNEYADRFPETYKSVVIAEDGCGNSVNLILERESDFILSHELYFFDHETGLIDKLNN